MITFEEAWNQIDEAEIPLILLGNGFSQAWRHGVFNYANLFDKANFGTRDAEIKSIFEKIGTYDFEAVMRALVSAKIVIESYDSASPLIATIEADQEILKNSLLSAISNSHPELPREVTDDQYINTRSFLSRFKQIFTVNYDLLMYWARNKRSLAPEDWRTDDGFRSGQLWEGYGTDQNVYFLHGALHIYDAPNGIYKHSYKEDRGDSIVEQVKANLAKNNFPLFVSEPTHEKKKKKIENNPYLNFCYRALESSSGTAFIYGHSLDENDKHIMDSLRKSDVEKIFISIYGDEDSADNLRIKANANAYLGRGKSIVFFDAATTPIW